jgi:hypothetical protein
MTKSRKRCGKSKGRGKRGGALSPLGSGNYPGSTVSGGQWSTSVGGNPLAQAANSHQTLLGRIAADSGGAGANPALAREMLANYAMKGPGQSGGGSRRHKRRGNHSKRMRKSQSQSQGQAQAQSQGQAQSQSGGMFATFGALLKEALVPLGLLAAQQAYGRSYGKKNRTRKNRK